jgi:hypothetical protein
MIIVQALIGKKSFIVRRVNRSPPRRCDQKDSVFLRCIGDLTMCGTMPNEMRDFALPQSRSSLSWMTCERYEKNFNEQLGRT